MDAPLAEVVGSSLVLLIAASVAALSLAWAKLHRPGRAAHIEYPRYYLSNILSYLEGGSASFPRRDLLFMAKSLRVLGYARWRFYGVIALTLLAGAFSFIHPVGRGAARFVLKRVARGV